MKHALEGLLQEALSAAVSDGGPAPGRVPSVRLRPPIHPRFGDFVSDVALVLARRRHGDPYVVGEAIVRRLSDARGWVARVEVAGPGFINLRLAPAFWQDALAQALRAGEAYGRSGPGVERPADPYLVVEDGEGDDALTERRAAVLADALSRILAATGGEAPPGADGGRRLSVGAVRLAAGGDPPAASLLDGAGADAVRFLLLREAPPAPIELDLDLARRRGLENPVVAVQYAHVRGARALRLAVDAGRSLGAIPDLGPLGEPEMETLRLLASYPDVLATAAAELAPQHLVRYSLAVAGAFHRYYNRHRILTDDRRLGDARLAMVRCVRQVLRSALDLIGVMAPEQV